MTAKTIVAYNGGRGARALGRLIDSNPYPFLEECADRRLEWDRGWLEEDADIAVQRHAEQDRAAQWSKDADHVDGFDRDDLGESPDF